MKILIEMIKHPRENAILWIALIVVIVAIAALLSSNAAAWRLMYCQNSAAHAIECTAKGWW